MNKNKDSFDFMGFFLKSDDMNEDKKPETSKETVSSIRHSSVNGRYILLVFLLLIITIGVAYGGWFVFDKLSTYFISENNEQSSVATNNESQATSDLPAQNERSSDQGETGKGIPEQNAKVDPTVSDSSKMPKPDTNLSESSKVISPEDRKPLLLEGKKTLFQRVLTRPEAVVYSQIPSLNTPIQNKTDDYVLIDPNELNCILEGYSSDNGASPESRNLIAGRVESLVCADKKIAIKSDMIDGGFLETVEYGKIKIQFNSSNQGSSFLLRMKPENLKALMQFVDDSDLIPLPIGGTLG